MIFFSSFLFQYRVCARVRVFIFFGNFPSFLPYSRRGKNLHVNAVTKQDPLQLSPLKISVVYGDRVMNLLK